MTTSSFLLACNSSHLPVHGHRLSSGIRSGERVYARDGRIYNHGLLGGGLLEATRGVPEAQAAARTYRRRNAWGLAAVALGAGCAVATPLVIKDPTPDYDTDSRQIGMLLGCLGLVLVGSGITLSGIPYQYDAINLYNTAIDQREEWKQLNSRLPKAKVDESLGQGKSDAP